MLPNGVTSWEKFVTAWRVLKQSYDKGKLKPNILSTWKAFHHYVCIYMQTGLVEMGAKINVSLYKIKYRKPDAWRK